MMRRMMTVAAATAALLVGGCAGGTGDKETAASADPSAQPVAVVNGEPISRAVWELFVKTRTGGGAAADLDAEQQKETLDSLIEMYIAAQQAEKDGLASGETGARLELMRRRRLHIRAPSHGRCWSWRWCDRTASPAGRSPG